MNKCYFQRWEETIRDEGFFPSGCTLHITEDEHKSYILGYYKDRDSIYEIPLSYDRIVGGYVECFLSDDLFTHLQTNRILQLSEVEMNNLINVGEILFKR